MADRYIPFEQLATEVPPPPSPEMLADQYASRIMEVCEHLCTLDIRETSWNSSPWIDTFLAHAGIRDPAPWCTSAACWVLQEAARRMGARDDTCPDLPSGAKLAQWALDHPDLCTIIWTARDLQAGDVVIRGATVAKTARIRRGSLASGHTYIAASIADGPHGMHRSFEGNTNEAGSREGDTFCARHRAWDDPLRAFAIRFKAIPAAGVV